MTSRSPSSPRHQAPIDGWDDHKRWRPGERGLRDVSPGGQQVPKPHRLIQVHEANKVLGIGSSRPSICLQSPEADEWIMLDRSRSNSDLSSSGPRVSGLHILSVSWSVYSIALIKYVPCSP